MNKGWVGVITGGLVMLAAAQVSAQSLGNMLQSTGQAVVQTVVQSLSPEAQTVVDQAKALESAAEQENFLVAQARQFLSAGSYQTAWDLANYVLTTLNSGSIDAQKILADAKTALMKIAEQKIVEAVQAPGAVVEEVPAEEAAAEAAVEDGAEAVGRVTDVFGIKE